MSDNKPSKTLVHIDLVVSDMERSLAFYTETMGLLVFEDCVAETEAAVFLSGGTCRKMRMVFLTSGTANSMMVELIQLVDDSGQGVSARGREVILAFMVSDLDDVARTMAEQGQHPVSDVFDIALEQLGHAQVVFYRDPDGYLIEFVAFTEAA